jgi:hypothetical protein
VAEPGAAGGARRSAGDGASGYLAPAPRDLTELAPAEVAPTQRAPTELVLTAPSRLALAAAFETAVTELDEAIALLSACGVPDCLRLPVGVADRLLLAAHRLVIGADMEAVARCEACGVLNSLSLGPDDVPPHHPRTALCGPGAGVREPTCADLLGLAADPVTAARQLLLRCSIGPSGLPRDAAALDRAEQSLCGPVTVACAECGAAVTTFVEVQHLVMQAVRAAVAEADIEVHLLASRYGWELKTIEQLPEARRSRLAALASGIPA